MLGKKVLVSQPPPLSRTGTYGMGVGRRRQVPDSGSQAQWGSRARTQSTQLP